MSVNSQVLHCVPLNGGGTRILIDREVEAGFAAECCFAVFCFDVVDDQRVACVIELTGSQCNASVIQTQSGTGNSCTIVEIIVIDVCCSALVQCLGEFHYDLCPSGERSCFE